MYIVTKLIKNDEFQSPHVHIKHIETRNLVITPPVKLYTYNLPSFYAFLQMFR